MDTITVIIMIAMFILLMAFVFSTALLTPIIGKRNLIFVLSLGFIVGIVGGAFFISPIFDDLPVLASSFYTSTSNELETVNVDVSTNIDINQFIDKTRNIEGVKSVQVGGITVKTTQFSPKWRNVLKKRIITSNKDIKSVNIPSNDTLNIQINESNPQNVIEKLEDWLMLVGAIDVKYSTIHLILKVDTSKMNSITDQISQEAVVTSINGPTQNKINSIKAMIPDRNNLIILCGFIGVLVGLCGLFIDSILEVVDSIKERMFKKKE